MKKPPVIKKVRTPSALKDGARCQVTGGVHAGKSGIVRDVKIGKMYKQISITVVQANGVRFKTLAKNVIIL
jgi:ribosomal protein S4E